MTENRNGLIVECELTEANGTCEREAGLRLLARQRRRRRRGRASVDRGYDVKDFVAGTRALRVTRTSPASSAPAPSTAARRDTPATRSASAAASWPSSPSAG